MKERKETASAKQSRPAKTTQGREDQLISLAVNLAEEQLRNGTASSQIITHYLKLATEKEKLERELLEQQIKLAAAKTEAYESEKRTEALFTEAMAAMRTYSGNRTDE